MSPRKSGKAARGRSEGDVFVVPFVDEGLGNSAYLVGSRESRLAALIDPLRDVDGYVDEARRRDVEITLALDTHLHNDFLSGTREVAARTGASIGASADAAAEFDHRSLADGDRLDLGGNDLEVLATPGHTPEHISFLLRGSKSDAPIALFSGGALIVGGAARTDLLGTESAEPLARRLYRTMHGKLGPLPDDVVVYPTHGAGSFCAAPTSSERTTTMGRERQGNRLLQARSEAEFVRASLEDLPSYPTYFHSLRPINRRGPRVLGGLPSLPSLAPLQVRSWMDGGGAVIDVRPAPTFLAAHIPGAYGIPLEAPLGTWAGWFLPFGTPLVLVDEDPGRLEAATRALIRIGFDDLRGRLEGGMDAWKAAGLPVEHTPTIPPADLRAGLRGPDAPLVLDVRRDDEWIEGHIPDAVHIENGRLADEELDLPRDRPIVVHCHTWNRSTAGLSVLARRGFSDLALLRGGFEAWESAGLDIERGPGA
jgi:hydroxyacylglutathione hydrolase